MSSQVTVRIEKVSATEEEAARSVEAIVDQDIAAFDEWCKTHIGGSLASPERSIVKTYIGWKLGLAKP